MFLALVLLVGSNLILGILFLHFQKDIVEQAVEDAQSVSDYMRKGSGKQRKFHYGYQKSQTHQRAISRGSKVSDFTKIC